MLSACYRKGDGVEVLPGHFSTIDAMPERNVSPALFGQAALKEVDPASIGRVLIKETPMTIERPDWGPSTDGPRETPGRALVPATASVQASESSSLAATVDDDESALHRKLIAEGIFTPEELGRHYNLSAEEVDALQRPAPKPPTRHAVDDELAAISRRRRTDRRGYNKDEKMQARERELLEARDKLKASTDSKRHSE